jgi:hypothetical protein
VTQPGLQCNSADVDLLDLAPSGGAHKKWF